MYAALSRPSARISLSSGSLPFSCPWTAPDRTQKLKDARTEAAKEIEQYKAKKDEEFKAYEKEVSPTSTVLPHCTQLEGSVGGEGFGSSGHARGSNKAGVYGRPWPPRRIERLCSSGEGIKLSSVRDRGGAIIAVAPSSSSRTSEMAPSSSSP